MSSWKAGRMRGIRYQKSGCGSGGGTVILILFLSFMTLVCSDSEIEIVPMNSTVLKSGRTILSEAVKTFGLTAELAEIGNKPEDKTFFGEDSNGDPIIVGTWFQYASYTLAVAIFGTGFLVACWATSVYYVLFVVTDPRQTGFTRRRRKRTISSSTSSVDGIGRIFTAVDLALDVFDTFDWREKDCFQMASCHVQNLFSKNDDQECPEDNLTTSSCKFPFNSFSNRLKNLLT